MTMSLIKVATKEAWAVTRKAVPPERLAQFDRGGMRVTETDAHGRLIQVLPPGSRVDYQTCDLPSSGMRATPAPTRKSDEAKPLSRAEQIAAAKADPNVTPAEFRRLLGFVDAPPTSTPTPPPTVEPDMSKLWRDLDQAPHVEDFGVRARAAAEREAHARVTRASAERERVARGDLTDDERLVRAWDALGRDGSAEVTVDHGSAAIRARDIAEKAARERVARQKAENARLATGEVTDLESAVRAFNQL